MQKGLFLGAGASYEVGMPLVWEFSNTLRINVLKRLDTKLFNFKSNESLKGTLIDLFNDQNKHYEEVIGELEKLYLQNHTESSIHHVLIQLIECIQLLMLEEQMNTLKFLGEKVKDYYGLKALVEEQGVLNVFSLNHDVVFEEICDYYSIPYRDGFFPLENKYKTVANFKAITKEQLESGEINLFQSDISCVNLIKLHGSLDIFAAEDKKLFLKVTGDGEHIGSNFYEIRKIEDHNLNVCTHDGIRTTNELCVYDDNNELQFLRRSLLSGAHKFQNRFEQIAPKALFEIFKKILDNLNELIIIGYGFGDIHINDVLRSWIIEESHTMIIYDPHREKIPEFLANNSNQVNIVQGGLTDFLLSINSSNETTHSKRKREFMSQVREELKKKRLDVQT
jgi:hypothetical protein